MPASRPAAPDGPYLIAGLGRAGMAAARALLECVPASEVRGWDGARNPRQLRARAELERHGVRVELGGDGTALLEGEETPRCVVKSPGVPPDAPLLRAAEAAGVAAIDELELGWRLDDRPVVAITGTNGKSTVAALVSAVLGAAGLDAPVAGNTEGGPALSLAPPGDALVVEVSSFQLEGCPSLLPEAAVFTGLSPDHLYRHGSLDRYADCKRRLFVRGERAVGAAAVEVGGEAGRRIAAEVEARGGRVVTYGDAPDADVRLLDCDWSLDATWLRAATPSGERAFELRSAGRHNALNALGALALAEALDVDPDGAAAAVSSAAPVPGRMEVVDALSPFDVVVDYAHNEDGVRSVLAALRRVADHRPGARVRAVVSAIAITDAAHRRGVGRAAAEAADDLVLTTERWMPGDPRDTPPAGLVEGAREAAGAPVEVVPDRAAAIEHALRAARPGDVVAILGRGAKAGVLFDADNRPLPFDDRRVARALIERVAAGG